MILCVRESQLLRSILYTTTMNMRLPMSTIWHMAAVCMRVSVYICCFFFYSLRACMCSCLILFIIKFCTSHLYTRRKQSYWCTSVTCVLCKYTLSIYAYILNVFVLHAYMYIFVTELWYVCVNVKNCLFVNIIRTVKTVYFCLRFFFFSLLSNEKQSYLSNNKNTRISRYRI